MANTKATSPPEVLNHLGNKCRIAQLAGNITKDEVERLRSRFSDPRDLAQSVAGSALTQATRAEHLLSMLDHMSELAGDNYDPLHSMISIVHEYALRTTNLAWEMAAEVLVQLQGTAGQMTLAGEARGLDELDAAEAGRNTLQ